jgi:hypothetical protein
VEVEYELTRKARAAILERKNVVGVGVGFKQVRGERTEQQAVVVFVKKKEQADRLHPRDLVPQELGGVITDVIEIGEIVLHASRTERSRPAYPGMSIGHYRSTAGTFGAVVKDRRTGKLLILSNNHVLANLEGGSGGRAKIGDEILQPGPYDGGRSPGDVIGHLYRFAALRTDAAEPTCKVARSVADKANRLLQIAFPGYELRLFRRQSQANLVDAALALPVDESWVRKEILELGAPTGVAEARVGQRVQKSGRSSGVTWGEIVAVDASLVVNMGEVGEAHFEDQLVATNMSQPGDSGSLVLDEYNRAVGLLFAGSTKATVINRMENVLRLLDISL